MKITKEYIKSLDPCEPKYTNYCKLYPGLDLTPLEFLALDKIPTIDRLWVILRTDFIFEKELHELACIFAERVLPIFEKKYPDDKRPRLAIEAKRKWLRGEIDDSELEAAANVAWAAASAAARAAARAAWAAASAAARAASVAANAARDAANAARAAVNKQNHRTRNVEGCNQNFGGEKMKITKEYIKSLDPCEPKYTNYCKLYPGLDLTPLEFLALDKIPTIDRLWVILRTDFIFEKELHELACIFAERVLPIFEKEYPDDDRPRLAIEAKRKWLRGEIDDSELEAAARAAWAAANVAAWAARDAARAAARAASAAANAARDAANAAAWAASDAASDAANAAWAASDAASVAARAASAARAESAESAANAARAAASVAASVAKQAIEQEMLKDVIKVLEVRK